MRFAPNLPASIPDPNDHVGEYPPLFMYDTDLDVFNLELAERVLDTVLADPDAHDQRNWVLAAAEDLDAPPCKTVACLAGHTAILAAGAGYLVYDSPFDNPVVSAPDTLKGIPNTLIFPANFISVPYTETYTDSDNKVRTIQVDSDESISHYARRQLGLGVRDAEQLFIGSKEAWRTWLSNTDHRSHIDRLPDAGASDTVVLMASNSEAIDVLRFYIETVRLSRDKGTSTYTPT